MDKMFTKYKSEFIAAINSTLDMLYNSKDLLDLKRDKDPNSIIDDGEYQRISQNILQLESVLNHYKMNNDLTKEEQNTALAALGTTVVHLEYLANCYKEAAKKAKIIIANIKDEE